jgi:sarcosine oxidase subunit alpha
VGGIFGDDLLLAATPGSSPDAGVDPGAGAAIETEVVTARSLVLAPGAHDGVLPFEGNDVPGVLSARAAGMLLAQGVLVGERVVVVVAEGGGPFGEAYARAVSSLGAGCRVTVVHGLPVGVRGSSGVRGVVVRTGGKERKLDADALVVDAPRSPAYELCEQAGAKLEHSPRGFLPVLAEGRIREGIWVVGEASGIAFDPAAMQAQAAEMARGLE